MQTPLIFFKTMASNLSAHPPTLRVGKHALCKMHFSKSPKCLQVANEIRKAGGQAIAVGGDVTAMDFPEKCVKATVDAFGQIDILVNNAGECTPAHVRSGNRDIPGVSRNVS